MNVRYDPAKYGKHRGRLAEKAENRLHILGKVSFLNEPFSSAVMENEYPSSLKLVSEQV